MGKAFRNEITPRNFIFRVREFEQMELEFFVKPDEDEQWHQKWVEKTALQTAFFGQIRYSSRPVS